MSRCCAFRSSSWRQARSTSRKVESEQHVTQGHKLVRRLPAAQQPRTEHTLEGAAGARHQSAEWYSDPILRHGHHEVLPKARHLDMYCSFLGVHWNDNLLPTTADVADENPLPLTSCRCSCLVETLQWPSCPSNECQWRVQLRRGTQGATGKCTETGGVFS